MGLIKQFNEDSKKLTKNEFAIKYSLKVFIVAVAWFTLIENGKPPSLKVVMFE
jgi:hypothetical protein